VRRPSLRILELRQAPQVRPAERAEGEALTGVDLDRVSQFARYSAQTAIRAQQLVVEIARLEKQIETARERLAEAMRARKAMELLRDRQYARWKQEQDRREAAELDEMAVQAYVRNTLVEAHA